MKLLLLSFFIHLICLPLEVISANELPKSMKAVGYFENLPIISERSLLDLEVDVPSLRSTDVLVEVKAIAVDPIDVNLRAEPPSVKGTVNILGWDGAGIVVAKGDKVKRFDVGDEVFFIGDIGRNGSNAQYVALDEVVVGLKPKKLSFAQAAAMPLTSTVAYDSIYDRLLISEKDRGKTLLIINSAGGVGSAAIQLAKNLGLVVIGTASRPETEAFSRNNGADNVINYKQDLKKQLDASGYENGVDYILVNYDPYPYWESLMKIIKPQGKICLIAPSSGFVDVTPMLDKSVSLVSEMVLTRLVYNTEDKYRIQDILMDISKMLDEGILETTLFQTMSPINARNLREAHRLVEERHMIRKIGTGWLLKTLCDIFFISMLNKRTLLIIM